MNKNIKDDISEIIGQCFLIGYLIGDILGEKFTVLILVFYLIILFNNIKNKIY